MTSHTMQRPTPHVASLRVPARLVEGAFALWLLLGTTAFVVNLMQRSLLSRESGSPGSVGFGEWRANDDRTSAINGTILVLTLVTAVLFIVWFRCAYKNVDELGAPRGHGLGWAIGGWFLPFANLVIPKMIADDINEAVCGRLTLDAGDGGLARLRRWTNLWWAGWIALIVTGFLLNSVDHGPTTDVHHALTVNGFYILRSVVIVVAAALALVMVRMVTRAFDRLGDPMPVHG